MSIKDLILFDLQFYYLNFFIAAKKYKLFTFLLNTTCIHKQYEQFFIIDLKSV